MSFESVTTYEDVVQLAMEDEEFFAALMMDPGAALAKCPYLGTEEAEEVMRVIRESVGADQKGAKTWLHSLLFSGVWRRR